MALPYRIVATDHLSAVQSTAPLARTHHTVATGILDAASQAKPHRYRTEAGGTSASTGVALKSEGVIDVPGGGISGIATRQLH